MSNNYNEFYRWIENTNIDPQKEIPCINFLYECGLTSSINSYIAEKDMDVPHSLYGMPVNRVAKNPKDYLDKIKKDTEKRSVSAEKVWDDYKNIKNNIQKLDYNRMPADCIAFYRPFHVEPFDEWGIYIHIEKLVQYCKSISVQIGNKLAIFSDLRDIFSFVLFDVFHHEFFHHIVESAATTIEIINASTSEKARPYYLEYKRKKYQNLKDFGKHPLDPIEEALANAYSYNSFSFLSRVTFGYKTAAIDAYQRGLKKVWKLEPEGYCYAERFINSGYKVGSTLLLSQILFDLNYMSPETIGLVAQSVLLKGHSAFVEKANIPVYLVGNEIALSEFNKYIPAPNETYTNLFMPHNDDEVDKKLIDMKKEEVRSKKK